MIFLNFIIFMVVLLFSVSVHELAHGWAADKLGDPTARLEGRLTLNPIAHLDPLGSIVYPVLLYLLSGGRFMFAWAKPVPINPYNFADARRGLMIASFAGPLSNFLLACGFAIIARVALLLGSAGAFLFQLASTGVMLNLILGVFNLVPVPPLDGSKVLMGILPYEAAYNFSRLEPYGFIILFALLFLGAFRLIYLVVFPIYKLLMGGVAL